MTREEAYWAGLGPDDFRDEAMNGMKKNIAVDITDASEFHCFRLTLQSRDGHPFEVMLHASALVDLIHECSTALCEWQKETTTYLICQKTGLSENEARERGLIA